jgi:hypothetical protein
MTPLLSCNRNFVAYAQPSREVFRDEVAVSLGCGRINALRGFCREFGIAISVGARTRVEAISRVLVDPKTAVADLIRGTAKLMLEEIHLLEPKVAQLKRELASLPSHYINQSPALVSELTSHIRMVRHCFLLSNLDSFCTEAFDDVFSVHFPEIARVDFL